MDRRAFARRLVRIPIWLLFVLILAAAGMELVIRLFDFDWRFLERSVYYQTNQLRVHCPDPDPRLMYRLRPGRMLQNHWTTINPLGARGPVRPAEKPQGVFRIVVLGASNAYGSPDIPDDRTWPAQLETRLNETGAGRYEVWNFGAHAYVGSQMAALGLELEGRLDPDLILVGLGNRGQRPFLGSAPIRPYFEQHPSLWREVFPEEFYRPGALLTEYRILYLIRHVRLVRYGLLAYTHYVRKARPWMCANHEEQNLDAIRDMIGKLKGRTRVCLFVGPHQDARNYQEFYRGHEKNTIILSAEGMAPEYRETHPPDHVLAWYAEKIAAWIVERYQRKPVG